MKFAMISIHNHNVRASTRESTLRQLERFGITPEVFFSELPLGIENHTENARNALGYLSGEGGLFLEDDLEFSKNFSDALAEIEASRLSPVALYVPGRSFLSAAVRRGDCGIQPLINSKKFYGSQAIYLSSDTIAWLLCNWLPGKFFDTQLQRLRVYGYFPNPVQHYGARLSSTWSKYAQPHRSFTYEH